MTATNHALTGALIGLSIANPVLAISVAILSHFILDAIPHFGFNNKQAIARNGFVVMLLADAMLCLSLVLLLGIAHPMHWILAAVSAFAAASPDFMWIPQFMRARAHKPQKTQRHILLFHHNIQWFQRPIGLIVEAAWLAGGSILLAAKL